MQDGPIILSARDLLRETYGRVCENNRAKEIIFSSPVSEQINSNPAAGVFMYSGANFFYTGGTLWALALGEWCGQNNDGATGISAFRSSLVSGLDAREAESMVGLETTRNSRFRPLANSLFLATDNGRLGISSRSIWGTKLRWGLEREVPRYRTRVASPDGLGEIDKYFSSLKVFLSDAIGGVLVEEADWV